MPVLYYLGQVEGFVIGVSGNVMRQEFHFHKKLYHLHFRSYIRLMSPPSIFLFLFPGAGYYCSGQSYILKL